MFSSFLLPDVAEDFSADVLFAGLAIGEQAIWGAHDGDAKAFEYGWNLVRLGIDAEAWLGDSLESGDDALAGGAVFEVEDKSLLAFFLFHAIGIDESLIHEDFGDAFFDLGGRHGHFFVTEFVRVADACEHISDWICVHVVILLSLPRCFLHAWDLAFVGKLTEADAAEAEATDDAVRTSTSLAAGIFTNPEFLGAFCFRDQ